MAQLVKCLLYNIRTSIWSLSIHIKSRVPWCRPAILPLVGGDSRPLGTHWPVGLANLGELGVSKIR